MPDFGDAPDDALNRYSFQGQVDPNAPSVANGQITPEQWEEYKRQRKRAAWIGGLTTVGGMLAAGPLANAAFGGAAAPGAVASGATGATATSTASMVAPAAAGVTAGAGAGMSPSTAILLMTLAGAAQGTAGSINARRNTQAQTESDRYIAELLDSRTRDLADQDVALEESKLDPFRAILAQIAAAEEFDRLATQEPFALNMTGGQSGRYTIPTATGGALNYRASPDLKTAAETARSTVLRGQGANPSIPSNQPGASPSGVSTNPSVNARRALMDLLATGAPTPPVSGAMPVSGARPIVPVSGTSPAGGSAPTGAPNDFRLSLDDLIAAPAGRQTRRRRQIA